MPYNTRRKSLSLPSLGIHVPVSNAARAAAAAALANRQKSPTALSSASSHSLSSSSSSLSTHSASSSSQSTPTFSPRSPTDRSDQQPAQTSASASAARKTKRPHALVDAPSSGDSSTSANKRRQLASNNNNSSNHTPPPSPGFDRAVSIEMDIDDDHSHAADHKIDLASIHDDIVEKVIIRLQATNNRPHIVKELAGILIKQLKIVEQSANPCAIISSRLSAYIKRPSWNSRNPCPLGKELETVHPRRTYFYLTTSPHQPLPDPTAQTVHKARELPTPSATSGSEAEDEDRRRELSPSPEVDLSPYELLDEFDDDEEPTPATPLGSYPSRHGISSQTSRTAEPPLEKDEKEFTQTANGLQRRKLSGQFMPQFSGLPTEPPAHPTAGVVVDEHVKDDTLFGDAKAMDTAMNAQHNLAMPSLQLLSSPHIRPAARPVMTSLLSLDMGKAKPDQEAFYEQLDSQLEWGRSPEQIDLDELDSMLTAYY